MGIGVIEDMDSWKFASSTVVDTFSIGQCWAFGRGQRLSLIGIIAWEWRSTIAFAFGRRVLLCL